MLRKGSAGLLRQALQCGLQQPVQQQSCAQLQVLSLQAVRFRSKPSHPKFRHTQTRAGRLESTNQKAIQQALAARGLTPFTVEEADQAATAVAVDPVAASPAAADTSSSTEPSDQAAADTSASSSSTTSSSTTSSSSSSSSWTPAWLSNLLGDTRRRRSRAPPASASPLTPSTAVLDSETSQKMAETTKTAQQARAGQPDDGWEALDQFKDYSLDDYKGHIKNDPKNTDDFQAPPRPSTPVRGSTAFYSPVFDSRRAIYVRYETAYHIIAAMSQEDKRVVKSDPTFHRNQEACRELAQKTGFSADAVRDMVYLFHKQRLEFRLMADYRQAGGKMPPGQDGMQVEALKRRLRKEHEDRMNKQLLAGRDTQNCELRKFQAWLGTTAQMRQKCPQTGLPFSLCCGRKNNINAKAARKQRRQLLSVV